MEKMNLGGSWQLTDQTSEKIYPATVPGCNFADLLAAGAIPDPFAGLNEAQVQWVVERDWAYTRTFSLTAEQLSAPYLELECLQLDTLAEVSLNGHLLGTGDNAHRAYRFDAKPFAREGENELRVYFHAPLPYLQERQKVYSLPEAPMCDRGAQHMRKAACHFGWDWGPHLPIVGITREISLLAYQAKIQDFAVRQTHSQERVTLALSVETAGDFREGTVRWTLQNPQGEEITVEAPVQNHQAQGELVVEQPQLWWCNGMGEQPLYELKMELFSSSEETLDCLKKELGLRTLELDTAKDEYGSTFRFLLNGVPVFARGANWIPSDSFVTRTDSEKLEELIYSAKTANMNLLRVWGGGYYETDEFYALCDHCGIMVWQDCLFACYAYPLNLPDYVENVHQEIIHNVRRLRHHACLALWCGNNEIESMVATWSYRKELLKAHGDFFYQTLREWIRQEDETTSYWATTPSGGEFLKNINSDRVGDTHLWHVWHGLRPVEFYRKRMTRFCSEFGLESLPSLNALENFAQPEDYSLNSPVFSAHQKCPGGNNRMLFYVLSRFWQPKHFEDMVYLTQLAQMECVRDATEHWRRNKGQCNGSLYWQFNDCWPVNSWAGMDYYGNLKALQYRARHFNEPVGVSLENKKEKIKLFLINDTRADQSGVLEWRLETFQGKVLKEGKKEVSLPALTSLPAEDLDLASAASGQEKDCVFKAVLWQEGEVLSSRTCLLRKENQCRFTDPQLATEIKVEQGVCTLTIQAREYARFVQLRMRGITQPFTDNYFDLCAGECMEVSVPVPENWTLQEVKDHLTVSSLFDVEAKTSRLMDRVKQTSIVLMPVNFVNWVYRFFDN